MKIRYIFLLFFLIYSVLLHADLEQSINESIKKIDDETQKFELYKTNKETILKEISENKVKFSDILISASSNALSKEKLNDARKELNSKLVNAQKQLDDLNKLIESSNNFYTATQKAEKSFSEIIEQTTGKTWKIKQILKKHKSQSEQFKLQLNELLVLRSELNAFIVLLNDWSQNFKQNVKESTFKWEKEKVLFSATVLTNIIKEFKEIPERFVEVGLDYNIEEPKTQKSFDIFVLIISLIVFGFILFSVFVMNPLQAKIVNKTNFIEASLLNSIVKNKWLFTASLFLFSIVLTYVLSFEGYPTLIYIIVLTILATITIWRIGLNFITILLTGDHGQLEFISEKEKKRTARYLSSMFTALCVILMIKIPKQIYGLSGDLYHTIYFIFFVWFIFLCAKATWKVKIRVLLSNRSKRVRFFGRITRVLFLFILFLILCSLVLEAAGFLTLSSTVQKIFLYNFATVMFAWMLYAIGTEIINVSFIKSLEKSKISFQESVAIKNFSNLLLNSSLLICSLFLIIKAWTSYIFIIPSLINITIFNLGEHNFQLMHVLKLIIAYFTMRLFYIFVTYWWEIFIFDYLNIEKKFEANFHALTKYAFTLIFFLIAGSILGFTYRNLVIIAGALGVGIGFGLQNIANNFISGIIMLFERPIRVGDIIEVDGDIVVVKHIGSRSTIVNTLDNSSIIIPNAHLISNKLTNWTFADNIIALWVEVGVQYGTDTNKVNDVIAKSLEDNSQILKSPTPNILFTEFADSSLVYKVKFWTDNPLDYQNIKSNVMQNINSSLAKAGIIIPFPQRDVHIIS